MSGADLRDIWVHAVGTGRGGNWYWGCRTFEFFYQRYIFKTAYFLKF